MIKWSEDVGIIQDKTGKAATVADVCDRAAVVEGDGSAGGGPQCISPSCGRGGLCGGDRFNIIRIVRLASCVGIRRNRESVGPVSQEIAGAKGVIVLPDDISVIVLSHDVRVDDPIGQGPQAAVDDQLLVDSEVGRNGAIAGGNNQCALRVSNQNTV